MLYPSEIFVSCCFRKNSLVSNFFFSLILQHIKKNLVNLFGYSPKYISNKKERKKERKKEKSFKKMFIGFCPRKPNKGKLDQINSELAQI